MLTYYIINFTMYALISDLQSIVRGAMPVELRVKHQRQKLGLVGELIVFYFFVVQVKEFQMVSRAWEQQQKKTTL